MNSNAIHISQLDRVWQFSLDVMPLLSWLAPLLILLVIVSATGNLKRWAAVTAVTTLVLIMLGAYVRLSDAGLGCPDWPGCYGKLTPTAAKAEIAEQSARLPDGPITIPKAWKEMVHRYLATAVGVLIVGMLIQAMRSRWQTRKLAHGSERLKLAISQSQQLGLMVFLLAVVILQGLFGKWTVTLLLKPAIVTGHLLGGMFLFALLMWLWQRQSMQPRYLDAEPIMSLRPWALLAFAVLGMQIALGGWVSTNYAALVCSDIPLCQGQVFPPMDVANGFTIVRHLGKTGDGGSITMQALTAIHWMHRLGAILTVLYLGWLGGRVARAGDRPMAALLHGLLLLQVVLGISNVVFSLPLWVSVAHNGVAALLLASLVVLNVRIARARLTV